MAVAGSDVETGTWQARVLSARRWIEGRDPVRVTLLLLLATWFLTFLWLGALRHRRFGTIGFDLGIYDQGIWLLSQFERPWVTIRGLHLFAHHLNLAYLAIVPIYWLGGGPVALLGVQLAAQVAAAGGIFLLARDRLANRWLALGMVLMVLLNPQFQIMAWAWFHPEVAAVAAVVFAYWAAQARRWRVYWIAVAIGLLCKEDVALAMLGVGAVVALRQDRVRGIATGVIGIGWYLFANRIALPWFNGGPGDVYSLHFAEFGGSPFQVAKTFVVHPTKFLRTATLPDRVSYYWATSIPMAFVFSAAPAALLVAAPMLVINIISSWIYQRGLGAHYNALVIAGLFIATVEGVAHLSRDNAAIARFLVGAVCATSLTTSVLWGSSPLSPRVSIFYPTSPNPRQSVLEEAVSMPPAGAGVSATYNLVTHLTHRERIYEFPVPWLAVNWGIEGERLDDPDGVDWLIVDRRVQPPEHLPLLERLLATEFELVHEVDGLVVARRQAES